MKGEPVILRVLMSAVGVAFVAVAVALVVVSKPQGGEIAEGVDGLRETAWAEIMPASDGQRDAGDAGLPDASAAAEALTDAAADGSAEELAGNAAAPDAGGLDGGSVVAAAAPVHAPPLKAPASSKKKPPFKPKTKKPR